MLEHNEMVKPKVNDSEDVNLETNLNPLMVEKGLDLKAAQKEEMMEFLMKFRDVFHGPRKTS